MSLGVLQNAPVNAYNAVPLTNEPTKLNIIVGSSPKEMDHLQPVTGLLTQTNSLKIVSLMPAHTRDIQMFFVRPSLLLQQPAKLKISKLSNGDQTPFAVCIIFIIFCDGGFFLIKSWGFTIPKHET